MRRVWLFEWGVFLELNHCYYWTVLYVVWWREEIVTEGSMGVKQLVGRALARNRN